MKTSKIKTIAELLEKILKVASDGNYIFRGENIKYGKISSTLYRVYQKEIDAGSFDVRQVEKEIVSEVKRHIHEKDDNVVLEQLQYFGGKTNQIDFSTDYAVALFFACNGNPEADGRLILLNKKGVDTHTPTTPQNRVIAQKSIFVRPPKGFVEPSYQVIVPSKLKKDVLEHLNKYHNINTATIYNDIHGYITQTAIHESAYMCFYRGLAHQVKAENDEAIEAYTKAIKLNPNYVLSYNNRGNMYRREGKYDLAIDDYTKAIELNPNYALSYNNRGNVYRIKGEHDLIIDDYNKAIELDPDYSAAYANRGFTKIDLRNFKGAKEDLEIALRLAEQEGDKDTVAKIQKIIAKLPADSDS